MKKYFLGILTISIIIFSGCSENDEAEAEKIIPVQIYEIKPDTISNYIKVTGSVSGENDAIVYSKINEKLDEIYVRPGQSVSAGQVLAVQYNATFKQAVDLAKASVKTAQSQADFAIQEFDRKNQLYEQKVISPQQFDQVKTQKETAENTLEQAKLQLAQANETYQNSFIKAPFSGVVGAIFYEKNQMVPPGMQVVQIVSPNAMKSKLQISTKDISSVAYGKSVEIKFPSIPDKIYKGVVSKVNQAIDPVTNLLEVEVQLIKPDSRIKSGIFGEFYIEVSQKQGIFVVPENSLMQRTEVMVDKETGIQGTVKKYFIFTVENGAAKITEVKTGISSEGRIEIKKGLKEKDTVIVVGQNIVRDGQKVKIVK